MLVIFYTGSASCAFPIPVGNRPPGETLRVLRARGKCVMVGFSSLFRRLAHKLLGDWLSQPNGKQIAIVNPKDLLVLKGLVESGTINPVIDRTYPFETTAQAVPYLCQGHAAGKVLIRIRECSSVRVT